jgi:signal transduction histidine kinase/DNA-binding response OmpR family regulator
MTAAADIVQALETPAVLVAADGRVLAANTAFEACGADPAALASLAAGDDRETLAANGALIAWTRRPLADGGALILGREATAGLTPSEQYLASLSHELRTPLTAVLGMADLLSETRLAADQRAYLGTLRDCGEHLLGLVNEVLDLARLDAGHVALCPAAVDARQILQSTAELLSPRAHAKGLEVAWSVPAGLPRLMADEGRLRQVLFNLAGNAVKFTETGGVRLGVEPRDASNGRVTLRFAVTDTGPGVPEAQRERIFEAFAQASPEHAARSDSAGLGLAIVRRLAAAHNGRAGLDSPAEGGARFWFEAAFAIAEAATPSRALAGQTVCVASANPVVRQAAAEMIEAAGGRAIACSDMTEAQAAAPAGSVVLIDHALARATPGKRPRLRPLADRPSVILLAPEERGRIARYRAQGFAGYLIKPLRDVSLVSRVLAVLGEAGAGAAPDERAASETFSARVLLVEDNPINALLARSLLEREGCTVERAATGAEALAAAAISRPDLVLMDLRLPDMDGREATRALRAAGCASPIVALTADAFEEDRRSCLAAGMDDFASKPLQAAVLRAMLRRWVARGWTRPEPEVKLSA